MNVEISSDTGSNTEDTASNTEHNARAVIRTAQRIVVKVGSSSLASEDGRLDADRVAALVDELAAVAHNAVSIVVVSSGAIASGLGPLNLTKRPRDLATAQAAASVGQGELVAAYSHRFRQHGLTVGQVLLTADDFARRINHRNAARTLNRLLELGVVPIVNENDTVATAEIRFGDNDRIAALVAQLVRADVLVLLSDVDALYDGPPSHAASQPIHFVDAKDALEEVDLGGTGSKVGSGGMRTKVQAARIANGSGIPVLLTSAANARTALAGERVGTFFAASGKRRPARLLWLEYGSESRGQIVIDDGAAKALIHHHASLLPAGITAVTGDFEAGDAVEVVSTDGSVIARGIVTFDASEVPSLMGRSTKDLAAEFGANFDREVIHRDALVLVKTASL